MAEFIVMVIILEVQVVVLVAMLALQVIMVVELLLEDIHLPIKPRRQILARAALLDKGQAWEVLRREIIIDLERLVPVVAGMAAVICVRAQDPHIRGTMIRTTQQIYKVLAAVPAM